MIRFGLTIRFDEAFTSGQVHCFAKAPGIDKSDNGHEATCVFLLPWLSTEAEALTKNGSMAPAGADRVVRTRAFGATVLVAVDNGLGRDLFSSVPLTLCCDSAFRLLVLLYGFLTNCTEALANDCGWF
jgi:hypothetical protein